ncbi:ATP synthase F1 subunit epsilon [Candidatus Daviesbacteria bacterium RIFCSPLOWO2_01_FULL_43_38]|uniref:ATP synthase epsilon chain n=2 Tax=Candidatus Daviesiibacteriota TaxID=1752718 RepID=A0A1F5K4H1_9BACT|nr:MAG: ATP synthase F1 subunit epsilon [Candidatus Daviesbacteria bacterium RIFCSPHIGHO2_01_FULL_43_17]OGE35715.1 MAG: ATP synthase F1 subunit epsilon [Candidatus Daviesbacteria bacterium RIFCSPHIGHO2_12_FULL_43_11]OGE63403.1 MAG: ATP synthase F1 subunit epsilon [Candidatus Daviesbacteria bacterium RIFCSPLOWO2_01_FULL_43_38]OGE70070.1 MAG: ATP synthase F1 subunit epsilon [Candidatus Daviesbacteria bacterium RIFCSPLOWO2_02_FULL_43_11]
MSQLHLKVVTPEKAIFDSEAEMVSVKTLDGEIGILPHHINLMAQVVPGELRIKKGNEVIHMAVGSGLLQMANNTLVIATDLALKPEEINEPEVEEARKRAQDALEQTLTDEEYAVALTMLEKTSAQLKVKRRHHLKV